MGPIPPCQFSDRSSPVDLLQLFHAVKDVGGRGPGTAWKSVGREAQHVWWLSFWLLFLDRGRCFLIEAITSVAYHAVQVESTQQNEGRSAKCHTNSGCPEIHAGRGDLIVFVTLSANVGGRRRDVCAHVPASID